MTFRDIERTWNELMFYYIENKNKITENVIDNVLKEFRQGDVKNMMFG